MHRSRKLVPSKTLHPEIHELLRQVSRSLARTEFYLPLLIWSFRRTLVEAVLERNSGEKRASSRQIGVTESWLQWVLKATWSPKGNFKESVVEERCE